MTAIEGTLNGFPFRATLEPDGQKSHWLKVDRKPSEANGGIPAYIRNTRNGFTAAAIFSAGERGKAHKITIRH
jgi:hypothetical protein